MPKLKSLLTVSTAITLLLGVACRAAEQPESGIANNDSIYIDGNSFKVVPGKGRGDASALINKPDTRAVGPGLIIFRSGDKLYVVDVSPSVIQTGSGSARFGSDRDTSVSAAQAERDFRDWQEFTRQNPRSANARGDNASARFGSDRDTSVSAAQAERDFRDWQEFTRQNPRFANARGDNSGARFGSDRDTSVSTAQEERDWQEFLSGRARFGSDRDTSVSTAQEERDWREFLSGRARFGSDRDTSVSAAQEERDWQDFLRNSRFGSDRAVSNDPEYAQYKLKKTFDDNWTASASK